MKKIYKITWMDTPDKDGNRILQYTTIHRESLTQAIQDTLAFFKITEDDIIQIERLNDEWYERVDLY